MRLFKQLFAVFVVLGLVAGALLLFSYDIVKLQWVSFMGLQPSFGNMEEPLPVPARSIPVDGPAYIPGMGAPENPVPADALSIQRGAELFQLNCAMCHSSDGKARDGLADGLVGSLLQKPAANLTLPVVQNKSDGALFLTISFGIQGRMPALNENLPVRDRWDIVNFLRSLAASADAAATPAP
jgi:mono/diheme cytochrome c family protein